MLEEEKKAIEELYHLAHINTYLDLHNGGVQKISTEIIKKWKNTANIALNLIQKQQKELGNLQKEVNEENRRCMLLAVEKQDLKEKLEKKDKELENWKMEYNHWCQLAIDRKQELEKKDKTMDEIIQEYEYNARINLKNFCDEEMRKDSCMQDCRACVKQYFAKKAEDK